MRKFCFFTNITANKELISKIYKELKKLDITKPNYTIKKWATDLNREFSIDKFQMHEKHLKKCKLLFNTKGLQIESTLRFHLIPVRTTKIKNTNGSSR